MTIEKTNYHGWANSYRISNGEVEAIVTGDVGPRVMRYGFVGGQNFFKEFDDQLGQVGRAGLATPRRAPHLDCAGGPGQELCAG